MIPGSGRSPGEGNGNPLQYFCLENSMDRVPWRATDPGVAKRWTQLSSYYFTFQDDNNGCVWVIGLQTASVFILLFFFFFLVFFLLSAIQFSSVKSLSQVQLFLTPWTHELQHARLPCTSPTPRACSNSCPSSR